MGKEPLHGLEARASGCCPGRTWRTLFPTKAARNHSGSWSSVLPGGRADPRAMDHRGLLFPPFSPRKRGMKN